MSLRIRPIATRLALILAAAAVLPLLGFGVVSLLSLQQGTRASVIAGNQNVAERAADEIGRYVSSHANILTALATTLQDTGLDQWQQDRILKDYVLQFREFRELTLLSEDETVIATSRVGTPRATVPHKPAATLRNVAMSAVRLDEEDLPTATFAVHLRRLNQPAGWLVGELRLEEMWRMVDDIRIGRQGFALVVAPDGTLVAHGNPDRKAAIAQGQNLREHPLLLATGDEDSAALEYVDTAGHTQLAAAATIPELGWRVIVEQPTAEAYASARALQRQLVIAISIALLAVIGVGLVYGRRFIAPIFTLKAATAAVAKGQLDTRVHLSAGDEFGDLGDAFNSMAGELSRLQEDAKRQERHVMLGRVAGGLFHDLMHPLMNIGNSATLLVRGDQDEEARASFSRVIERDLGVVQRFMDDLRNIVKPKPVERFAVNVNTLVAEIIESMRGEGQEQGVAVETRLGPDPLVIDADRFALGRVLRNLVTNAIQATSAGGRVWVTSARDGEEVVLTVGDTGSGIPPDRLPVIFDDFVTTKRRGMGLGLANAKRIVEQLDGTIAVASELGRGTTFTLRFPARDEFPARAAAS
jgi:signal transduction histidine kinase